MSTFDFNNADAQREMGLVPDGTLAMVVMVLRPGGQGGGWLTGSAKSPCLALDCEFTIEGGPFDRRKFWDRFTVDGAETQGQHTAVGISRAALRAMIEAAYGINPKDETPAAMERRRVTGWHDFSVLRFPVKVAFEAGDLKNPQNGPQSERYPDKNRLGVVITPDSDDYMHPGEQAPRPAAQAPAPAQSQQSQQSGGYGGQGGGQAQASNTNQAGQTGGGAPKPAWAA